MTPEELAELEPRIERLASILELSINSCDDADCCPRPTSSAAVVIERAIDRINVLDTLAESRSRHAQQLREAIDARDQQAFLVRIEHGDALQAMQTKIDTELRTMHDKSTRELGDYVLKLEKEVARLRDAIRGYQDAIRKVVR